MYFIVTFTISYQTPIDELKQCLSSLPYYILVSHILRQIAHLYHPSKNQRESTFWGRVQQFKSTVNNTFYE